MIVFLSPAGRSELRNLLQTLQRRRERIETEISLQPRDVPARRVQVTVIRDEDKPDVPVRLLWVLQNATERRAAEAALQS